MKSLLTKSVLVLLVVAMVGGLGTANATSYNFTSITLDVASNYFFAGMNNNGDLTGFYGPYGSETGFVLHNGISTNIKYPLSTSTITTGINDSGKVAGTYTNDGVTYSGFTYQSGTYTPITISGSTYMDAGAINNAGQIVGSYADNLGYHGYLLTNGTATTLDVPGAVGGTFAFGINNLGKVVGSFQDVNNNGFGYKYNGGAMSTFSVTQAQAGTPIAVLGINDSGMIVGNYTGIDDNLHGFIYANGVSTTLDFPGAVYTWAEGINDLGQIVGTYSNGPSASDPNFGFVATPTPLPGTIILLGSGLFGLVGWRRFRKG